MTGFSRRDQTTLFVMCGGEAVYVTGPVASTQQVPVPDPPCDVGVYQGPTSTVAAHDLVVRRVEAGGSTDPVTLDLGGALETVTLRPVAETGAPVYLPEFGGGATTVVLGLGGGDLEASFWTASTSFSAPPGISLPTIRYDVPEGAGYVLDWTASSWPTAETAYRFKGHVDTDAPGGVWQNDPSDLAAVVVQVEAPEGAGPLSGTGTVSLGARDEAAPFQQSWFTWCSAEIALAPPYRQRLVAMPDAPTTAPVVARAGDHGGYRRVAPDPCDDTFRLDQYVAAAPAVRREADGAFRAYPAAFGAAAPTPVADTLRYGVGPLAYVYALVERFPEHYAGHLVPSAVPDAVQPTPHWPLPVGLADGFYAPVVFGQYGDARPVQVPYRVFDAAGERIASGPDLTAITYPGVPPSYPATLTFSATDPGIEIGGRAAGLEAEIRYGARPDELAPPYLRRLAVEADGRVTDRVEGAAATVRLELADHARAADSEGSLEAVALSVRPTGGATWTPLELVEDAPGVYHAALAVPAGGAHDLRVEAADAAGNTATYTATPAFEALGPVATVPDPPAGLEVGLPAPNPTASRATVVVTVPAPGPVRITVLDALGRRVLSRTAPCGAGPCAVDLGLEAAAPGAYAVRVEASAGAAVRRLTVAR